MRRAWRVAIREYLENARTKGFWVGIILFPVMIVIFSHVPQFLEEKAVPTRHYTLVDRSGEFGEYVRAAIDGRNRRKEIEDLGQFIQKHKGEPLDVPAVLEAMDLLFEMRGESPRLGANPLRPETYAELGDAFTEENYENEAQYAVMREVLVGQIPAGAPEFVPPRPRFVEVPLPEGISAELGDAALEEAMRPYLAGNVRLPQEGNPELFALIVIPADVATTHRGLRYWSKTLTDTDLQSAVRASIGREIRQREFVRRGVDAAVVKQVQAIQVRSESFDPKKAAGEEKVSFTDTIRQWAPIAFVYLLWIAIFSIAQMLLNNMIEEKSNRIVEVLLSSVTPTELMGGKLAGIALVGLTMLGAWLVSLYGVLKWKADPGVEWAIGLLQVVATPGFLIPFAAYFLLGYLLYAGLFASIGSICNTLKEAQNFMGPVMMIMMVPLITMFFIPRDPNGTLATVLSWVPFYTPFVMMNRAAADPPLFDVVGTLVLLIASTAFMLWASGKIFRVGMLRTGQPPRIIELWRWIRHPA
jgi:ABC-2 type transport system permease protein